MLFLRVLGGLIAAVVVGLILGAIKDYLKLWDGNYQYVWPFAMGAASFVGALVMALIKPSRLVTGGSAPVRHMSASKPAAVKAGPAGSSMTSAPAPTTLPAGMQTSAEVPGMPTFDFDKARATGSAMDSAKGAGSGSRPAGKDGQ